MTKNCAICGKPSGMYPLCKDHFKLKDEGKVKKCETCGTWYLTDEGCPNCKAQQQEPVKEIEQTKAPDSDELTCLICGKPSNGKHFCFRCYQTYKDKVLYLQVKKCKEFYKLDADYESELTCEDGHMVKSPYEKIIDNWLYQAGIQHAYEKSIDIDETHDIHPDFYIPEFEGRNGIIKDIYIEFWGYGEENIKYTEIKNYKMSLYPTLCKERGFTVLYLTKSDCDKTSTEFLKKLKYLTPHAVNPVNEHKNA